MMDFFKKFQKNIDGNVKSSSKLTKEWYSDNYHRTMTQRDMLIILLILAIIAIIVSLMMIRFIKNTNLVEPFVIEIESKTGVPTIVQPITVDQYSADEAIKKYFIMKYIRAREEYTRQSFMYNYSQVVRVLSSNNVYYSDYRPKFNPYDKNSPYMLYGDKYIKTISLKSIFFQSANVAQIRVRITANGDNMAEEVSDKLIYLEFSFQNLAMTSEERMINPLGFVVTLYRITDEKVG